MENDLSINKRTLWRYVNRQIRRTIHHYHVFSVITILFDEMIKDLKLGKSINIFNFGILSLYDTKPRKYHDVTKRQIMLSKGSRIMKFKLAPVIHKKLRNYLDLDKTLEND